MKPILKQSYYARRPTLELLCDS